MKYNCDELFSKQYEQQQHLFFSKDTIVKSDKRENLVSDADKAKLADPSNKVLSMSSTILLEGLMLTALQSKLSHGFHEHPDYGCHIERLYDTYICNNKAYLEIEKINGYTYTQLHSRLSPKEKNEILFQLTAFLKYMQENFKFNHNDLIGVNIMLVPNNMFQRDWVYDLSVNGKMQRFVLNSPKYLVKLIDFEMSRCEVDGVQFGSEYNRNRFYRDMDVVPFNSSSDFCKIFTNPNMTSHLLYNDDYQKLFKSDRYCRNSGPPFFSVIPFIPKGDRLHFSDLCADDILASSIFDEFKN